MLADISKDLELPSQKFLVMPCYGTYDFVSFILKVAFVGLSTAATAGLASGLASLVALFVITQFSYQVEITFFHS